ncbi:MAG: hypothetical protein WBA76_11765 [Phormidesmis sp.]
MSLSPLESDASQLSTRPKNAPLSLSQALLITAGLAGLVGISSGIVIRFSLSHSSNARFLSPLQTFPALSNWAPELPQGTASNHYLPGGATPEQQTSDLYTLPSTEKAASAYPEEPYPDAAYPDATYPEEPYYEEPYPEASYPEDENYSENYPAVEAPVSEEPPY